ncbi:hypothetical protein [Clostridium sp.]|uniref:hypothetical protein n=1 Tax=Clostridium sp. TaxID=1506 RepID=UPI0028484F5E|nr:hypothetical protein [Clostridium sp.]MDR3594167.1 hypothetical protein [Clostridium sp.]
MGIKMKEARKISDKKIIKIKDATDKMRKNKELKCITNECDAKITWAKRHMINSEIENKFFRLLQGETHSNKCKYNTSGRVEILAKSSDKNILKQLENNCYEFRLNLIVENLKEVSIKKEDEDENSEQKRKDNLVQKSYRKNGQAKPYLSLMRDVMILRSEVEEDEELKKHIKLTFDKKKVDWSKFFYDEGSEEKIYDYIKRNGYKSYNKTTIRLEHPICIEGAVAKKIIINQDTKVYFINYKLSRFIEPNQDNEVILYKVSLMTKDKKIAENLNKGIELKKIVHLITYSIPYADISQKEYIKNDVKMIIREIKGWINYEEQIYIVEDN